jgi:hypothetical protein
MREKELGDKLHRIWVEGQASYHTARLRAMEKVPLVFRDNIPVNLFAVNMQTLREYRAMGREYAS